MLTCPCRYVAKYATKTEREAPAFSNMLSDILSGMDSESTARSACQKLLNKMVGERTYSAQETSHLLLGIPLVRSSVSFTNLNLSSGGALRELTRAAEEGDMDVDAPPADDSEAVTGDSWVQRSVLTYFPFPTKHLHGSDRYTARGNEMANLSMHNVFTHYSWNGKEWRRRRQSSNPIVLRVFPRLSPNPEHATYEEYCRVRVMLHHPYRSLDELRMVDGEERSWSELFAACRVAHGRDHPKDCLRDWDDEKDRVEEEEDDDEETVNPDLEVMTEEDWQLYAGMMPNGPIPIFEHGDIGNRPLDQGWDPSAGRSRWQDVNQMAGYIQEQKRARGVDADEEMGGMVDVDTLAVEQRAVYDAYVDAYRQILDGHEVPPLHLNIDGTAGCGKTYLIHAICQTLRRMAVENARPDPVRVMAPSGVAALNINGRTCHSAFAIPASNGPFKELSTGSRLANLQEEYRGVHFFIIDEKSMLGMRMFGRIDSRLRQIRPDKHDVLLGGFHLALFGDFAQLPPVGDRSLYAPAPRDGGESQQLARQGAHAYKLFTIPGSSFQLRTVHRQQGPEQERFRQLLARASKGGLTRDDWEYLVTRDEQKLSQEVRQGFEDATCLFTKCEAVNEFNLTKLVSSNQPCARVQAKHDGGREAKAATADEAMGLESDCVVSIGARVMISRNIWQREGLVNGTLGDVYDVIWGPGASRSDLPIAVLVACPTYKGPTLWRTPPAPDFPHGIPLVPITPFKATFEIGGKTLSRTQLPLRLAWAVTVHKSQGLTLGKVRVGLGKKEFSSGLTFVALSRVKTFEGLMLIERVDYSRVQTLGGKGLQERLEDFARRYP